MPSQVVMLTTAILLVVCALAGARADTGEQYIHPVDLEDAKLTVPQLVSKYGYPVEEHNVVTTDGYILGLHRVPHGRADSHDHQQRRKPACLVMHGLISSSADYFVMGPGQGLGYQLADEGYDVWLGNARGNSYSRRHSTQNPNNSGFWDFSWEEIGRIDLAAMIDYILQETGQDRIHYIGHSQGTTSFFVLMSMRPEYNDKIKTAHLMAPVAFMRDIESPMLQSLASYSNTLMNLGALLGMHEMLSQGTAFEYDFDNGDVNCLDNPLFTIISGLCDAFKEAFVNQDTDEFNAEMMPVVIGHTPAGSSLKQFAHYGQMMSSGDFRRWSYTLRLQNILAYGRDPPPPYPLENVTCQVSCIYSKGDALTSETDVNMASSYMRNSKVVRTEKDISHFDFVWGNNARKYVYQGIFDDMADYEKRAL